MSSNYKLDVDLKEAEAMAGGLSEYVRGNDLYGSTGGGMFSRMPSLTPGALLLRLRRLDALRGKLEDRQSKRLDAAIEAYDSARREWTQHYEDKLVQEANSRIDSMATFFEECDDSPAKCFESYRTELLKRTIVQEVLREMHELNVSDAALISKINAADNRLKTYFKPATFQWSEELKPVYPEDEFWWLYQAPQA
jgi:hypothetical protein